MRDKGRGQSGAVKSVLDHQDLQKNPHVCIVRKERKKRGHSLKKTLRQAGFA